MDRLLNVMSIFSLLLAGLVLASVRRAHIRVEYSVSWLAAALVLLVLSRWRGLQDWIAAAVGVHDASLALLMAGTIRAEAVLPGANLIYLMLLGLGGILFVMALGRYFDLGVTLPTLLLVGGGIFSVSYLMLTGQMRDAGRVRLLVTLVFGLIHGFGFASNLLEMKLPANRLAELLVGFNIGVEIGQVTVVLGALLVAWLLVRAKLAIPRPLFTDIAAAFLVGEGLCWFVERSVTLG